MVKITEKGGISMKKVWILLLPAIVVLFSAFCTYPQYISSPAPSAKEEVRNEESLFLSEAIQTENRSMEAEPVNRPLDSVAFDADINSEVKSEHKETENGVTAPVVDIDPDSFAIVGLGDSLTAGTGSEHTRGYLDFVEKFYEEQNGSDVVLVNHGVYGAQTGHLLRMLNDSKMRDDIGKADVLFITIGGNDLVAIFNENFTHLSMDPFIEGQKDYSANLRKIMSTIRLLNESAPVYFVGIFNPVFESIPDVKEFNDIITGWNGSTEKVLEMYPNTTFVPIQEIFEKDTHLILAEDFFHPNDEGYRRIGEEIIAKTEEVLMARR